METLWLALHLPQLSLAIHPALPPGKAVVEQNRITACDAAALQAGVRPWMKPALARSLLPSIALLPRDSIAEQALLNTLACWAGTWTPRICMLEQQGLLLEIGSCLRLFGGFAALHGAIIDGLQAQGHAVRSAAAPSAQGAWWLALAGNNGTRVDNARLPAALDTLSLAALDSELPAGCITRLHSFGLSTLGDVRRLPHAALTRRLGALVMRELACAYGEMPDPRADFVFPAGFDLRLELPVPVDNADALLFASRRLVQALSGWLTVRQGGIRACRLLLEHRRQAATSLPLNFAEPLRDGMRIEAILRERLPRVALRTQVEALRLVADSVFDLPGQSRPLFRKDGAQADAIPALMERLRARLGDALVHGYAVRADHRPECVSVHVPRGREQGQHTPPISAARPLYLLKTAQPLAERDGRPHHSQAPLLLLAGPERIESGWWDEGERNADTRPSGDMRRDYFVALTPDQRWLWIYRECRADLASGGGWFLHGYFS
ncbi:MAG TPA: DNA polymerase Y family protein [Rhodocyclaceae bacterium]|nr:DNA polymerase Y family protein [Rhodocyclaceae bacterium]